MRRAFGLIAIVAVLGAASMAGAADRDFALGKHDNVVLLGDSITADGTYGQIMQDLIDAKFPERQIRVMSHGASGDTVQRSLGRVDSDIVQWRPAWVLVNLGINDAARYTKDEYIRHYEALINRIYRDSGARVGIVSPVYIDNDREDAALAEKVAALPELARKYDALYIPLYERFKEIRPGLPTGVKYAVDGVHCNVLGYWIFAETILQSLGYQFDKKAIAVEIPARRLVVDQADTLAGTTFTVPLPSPVKVTLTNPPPGTATATRARKPIKLDGNLDDWDLAGPMLLDKPWQRTGGVVSWTRDHNAATAWACYDDKAFYFAIAVDDSVVRHMPNLGIVERDCVEVCVDLRSADERAAAKTANYLRDTKHVCQYIIAPATKEVPNPAVQVGAGDQMMAAGTSLASSTNNTGYILEFSVPASQFPGGTIAPGMTVPFDFAVNDFDRNDSWADIVQFRWSGSAWSFFSTREWGMLKLEQ